MKIFSKNLIIPLLLAVSMTAPVLQAKKHCRKSSRLRTQYHKVLLDLEDGFWNKFMDADCNPLDFPFEATLQITTIGDQVYIQVPAMNFTMPETNNQCYIDDASFAPPAGGYVYLKDGFLPKCIRPNTAVPLTFTLQSAEYPPLQNPPISTQGISYELQIDTEGRIKIGAEGFNPIPVGRHSLLPTSVSYIVTKPCKKAPKNVPISETPSTPNLDANSNQFLELQMSSFENGKVAFTFGDNSGSDKTLVKCKVAVGDVVTKRGKPSLKFTVPQLTFDPSTQLPPFQYGTNWQSGIETDVAINPTDTNNIVWTGTTRAGGFPFPGPWPTTRFPVVTQFTMDGGLTWSAPARIDFNDLTRLRSDCRMRTDPYGNFWVVYANMGPLYDPVADTATSIIIFNSSDGGATWNVAAEVLPPNPTGLGFDYPMLHWGGDGNGGIAMYFSWIFIDFDGSGNFIYPTYLAAMPVSGLGSYGPIQVINNFPQIDNFLAVGEIMATPDGTVIFGAADAGSGFYGEQGEGLPIFIGVENHKWVIVHEGGLNNFTPEGFSEPRLVNFDTYGQSAVDSDHLVVWQANRGVNSGGVGGQGLAYDAKRGRLYALILSELNPRTVTEIALPGDSSDQASLNYNQGIMNLIWSYDFGQTWSDPIPLRDSKVGQVGDATIQVDPTTGNISVGWYDPREDAKNQQQIKWYATVLAPPADPKTT